MKINIITDISLPIPYLAKFWFTSYGSKCFQPIQLQDSLKFNISRKKWTINFIFGMQISIEVFHKLIPSFWLCVTRHVQSTQNKFAYLFNISRITWWMKLMFFCLQLNTSILFRLKTLGKRKACPKYPKQVYNIFAISQGKCERWSWFFACWEMICSK